MIRSVIDPGDAESGQVVPSEVIATVEAANETLSQLVDDEHEHLFARWHRFKNHNGAGWGVELEINYDNAGTSFPVQVGQLRDVTTRKQLLLLAISDFAKWLRRDAMTNLRRIGQASRRVAGVEG